MSKVGDVVFCVDCDLARGAQLKVAVGDSSAPSEELPRRMATKKDASGDALCRACLDARVQRRRAEFLQPRARSEYPEPQPAASTVRRPSVFVLSPKKSIKSQTAATGSKKQNRSSSAKRKTGAKRKAGRLKGAKNRTVRAVGGTLGGLKKAEAQLLELVLEHGMTAVRRMVEGVNERIRKLV